MMAILPPTSPTTVIGGFSFAIITGKHRGKGISALENNRDLPCNPKLELERGVGTGTCKHHARKFNPSKPSATTTPIQRHRVPESTQKLQ